LYDGFAMRARYLAQILKMVEVLVDQKLAQAVVSLEEIRR